MRTQCPIAQLLKNLIYDINESVSFHVFLFSALYALSLRKDKKKSKKQSSSSSSGESEEKAVKDAVMPIEMDGATIALDSDRRSLLDIVLSAIQPLATAILATFHATAMQPEVQPH